MVLVINLSLLLNQALTYLDIPFLCFCPSHSLFHIWWEQHAGRPSKSPIRHYRPCVWFLIIQSAWLPYQTTELFICNSGPLPHHQVLVSPPTLGAELFRGIIFPPCRWTFGSVRKQCLRVWVRCSQLLVHSIYWSIWAYRFDLVLKDSPLNLLRNPAFSISVFIGLADLK